jgi:DNA-binding response OmpR family regulator
MEMLQGSSMKEAYTLSKFKATPGNTETNPPVIPLESYAGRKTRILVVDDDESIRRIMSEYLICIGFDVIEANNGYMGQHLFLNTVFNLVVTDLEMPGMDGWTLAFNIKKEAPDTPVIMVTGADSENFMQNIKEDCIDIVMFKPFRMKELAENIKLMLGPGCH